MKIKNIVKVLVVPFILTSCLPAITPVPPTMALQPTSTDSPQYSTPAPTQPLPSPTEIQLPFNDKNVESKYCKFPVVYLPVSDTQGLNEDGIAEKLMGLWLDYFNNQQAPDYCRIDGYHIDKVYYDERTPNLPLVPKGDFMRVVEFSIKLIQIPNFWMSISGEIDQQNWCHISQVLAIFEFESDGVYTMRFSYP